MKAIGHYKNGNYFVTIFDDGTKVRETPEDEFIPAFSENCDCKITDKCDGNCSFCYENCTPDGEHADLFKYRFIDSLHPYTELAINGNDLSHPDLIPFLEILKKKKVIVNMTVNQIHFEKHMDLIDKLVNNKLIHGIGISLRKPTPEFIESVKKYPNAVIHVIAGILSPADVRMLSDHNLKMLILGYKNIRRGADWFASNETDITRKQEWLASQLSDMMDHFNVISFDNLAISQLNVRSIVPDDEWDEFYMGDDGDFTFYIDMVSGTFCKNSIAENSKRYAIGDMTVDEMFAKIRSEK